MRLPSTAAWLPTLLLCLLAAACGTPGVDQCEAYCEGLDACLEDDVTMRPTANLALCIDNCGDLFANVFEDDACGRAPGRFVTCAANVAESGSCTDVLRINRAPTAEGETRPCIDPIRQLSPCGLSVPASF